MGLEKPPKPISAETAQNAEKGQEKLSPEITQLLSSMEGLSDSDKALKFLEFQKKITEEGTEDNFTYEDSQAISEVYDNLTGLDSRVIDELIATGQSEAMLYEPDKFVIEDADALLQKIISSKEPGELSINPLGYFVRTHPGTFSKETFAMLMKSGYTGIALSKLDKFPPFTGVDLVPASFTKYEIHQFLENIESYTPEIRERVESSLLALGGEELADGLYSGDVRFYFSFLSQATRNGLANKLLSAGKKSDDILGNLFLFNDIEYLELVKQVNAAGTYDHISEQIQEIPASARAEIGNYIVSNVKHLDALVRNLEWYEGFNQDVLVEKLLADDVGEGIMADYIDKFDPKFHQVLFDKLMAAGLRKMPRLLRSMNAFVGIAVDKDEIVRNALESMGVEDTLRYLNKFDGLSRETSERLLNALMYRNFSEAVKLNGSFTPPFKPELERFAAIVGPFGSMDLFHEYLNSNEDKERFSSYANTVRQAMREDNEDSLREVVADPILLDMTASFVRFKTSAWGSRDTAGLVKTVETYLDKRESYVPLDEAYAPGTMQVLRESKNRGESAAYSPEFVEKWKNLLPSLQEAERCISEPNMLVDLFSRFSAAIDAEKVFLEEARERAPNPMARQNVEKRLAELESISLGSIEEISDAFVKLYDRKKRPELAEIFRVAGLYGALKTQFTDENRPTFSALDAENPSKEDIARVLEFVQHVAHQETWEQNEFFATKEAQAGLDSLFHVKALENELAAATALPPSTKSSSIEVVPSRDLLTELSGQIGDACWASKYNILEEHPNFTSLTFFTSEQVAGASLLVDTQTESGEEVTIIRGLNPLEAMINRHDSESFMREISNYLRPIAAARGRKLAIVIDGHAGGSATNRPLLFAYLSGLRGSLQKVDGVKSEDTTFNGYDISNVTYYLPDAEGVVEIAAV